MVEEGRCVICRSAATERSVGPSKRWHRTVECPRCGSFEYDSTIGVRINSLEEMVVLSGWVREQNLAGVERPLITREIVARVTRRARPLFRERALAVLAELYAQSPGGAYVAFTRTQTFNNLAFQGRSYSGNSAELGPLLRILEEEQLIKPEAGDSFSISVKGLMEAEALGHARSSSPQAFVAMNFDERLSEAWTNGFDPAILDAGFHPFRIDNKDYVGGITDEIMAEIRRSRFVIADYTGQKAGVYFEAGFALGLGMTVIPTCHADEIGKLHFDIRHLNTLLWMTPMELAEGLTKRIRAVVGIGPND